MLPSLQLGGAPPTQTPPEQVSFVVQALPSLHGAVLFKRTQPLAGLHESSVQALPSLQLGGAPPTQTPPEQVSFVVQALPSLQGLVLSACTQPLAGLHESSVQALPSLQLTGAPMHAPAEQVSLLVHASPSLQGLVLFTCTQPLAGLHESSVQTFPSLQLGGAPPTQAPPEQVSFVVQALPSLQELVLFTCTQPLVGLHESLVHTLPSLQLTSAPTQTPPEQVSLVVQASPSLQGAMLFTCTQPLAGLHESSVQTLPSSQLGAAPPTQAPPEQVSFVVQALPSLQGLVLFACTQPLAGLHESSVQALPSLQFTGGPSTHNPPEQVSFVVQALPSSQGLALFVNTHLPP